MAYREKRAWLALGAMLTAYSIYSAWPGIAMRQGEPALPGMLLPFGDPPWRIVNTALLAIVIAETIRLALIVASYRRGWHG